VPDRRVLYLLAGLSFGMRPVPGLFQNALAEHVVGTRWNRSGKLAGGET